MKNMYFIIALVCIIHRRAITKREKKNLKKTKKKDAHKMETIEGKMKRHWFSHANESSITQHFPRVPYSVFKPKNKIKQRFTILGYRLFFPLNLKKKKTKQK